MFELGPKQKTWIAALRSGKYKQGNGKLCSVDFYGNKSYCCLGVANDVLELGVLQSSAYLYRAYTELGLRDYDGSFIKENVRNSNLDGFADSLAALNDSFNYTFEQIADYIEQNPENVFLCSL